MAKDTDGSWLWQRCYACGHRLRFASTGCPQCGENFDGRTMPKRWPEHCDCERCEDARASGAKEETRMSERAPEGAYVYQPHPVSRKDGRLWQVGGIPDGLTREEAQQIADAVNRALAWRALSPPPGVTRREG